MTTASPDAFRHYMAGLQAIHEGRTRLALQELKRAVAIDTTFALGYLELSHQLNGIDDRAAERAFQRAWALRSSLGFKDRMRLEALNPGQNSIDIYRELVARWPEDREVLHGLAEELLQASFLDEASRIAEKGASLYPEDLNFLSVCGGALLRSARLHEALEVFQTMATREPRNPSYWDNIATTYLILAQPDSAERAFQRALAIDRSHLSSRQGLALVAYCRGNVDDAIGKTEAILRQHGLPPDLRGVIEGGRFMSLAFFQAEAGRFKEALAINSDALHSASLTRSNASTQLALFQQSLLLDRHDSKGALIFNRHAERYVTERARLTWLKMDLFIGIDSLEAAQRELDEAYQPNVIHWGPSGYAFFFLRKARLMVREGHPDSALTYLDEPEARQMEMYLNYVGIQYRDTKARALQATGRPADAIRVLQDMLRIFGGHALGHYELGKLYEATNGLESARREYTRFLEMWSHADPELPELTDARRRLKALGT